MLNATAGMHGKLHSQQARLPLRALTRSLTAQASMVDDVWELSQRDRASTNDVGGESIFLPTALSQVHLRRQSKQAHPCPMSAPQSLSFRVAAVCHFERVSQPCYFGKRWMGSNCALWSVGTITMGLPTRYGNCTSEANLRVLRFNFPERHKRRTRWCLVLLAHCHHLSSKWACWVAIYLPLLAIRQL